MTGMDKLLASLTPEHLLERAHVDALDDSLPIGWADELYAQYMRWLIEDLEKRINE
jgi:hypothetical protein